MRLESESVLDDESASRHEEISTTLVGFLEAIEPAKLKEAAEEAKAKPARRVARAARQPVSERRESARADKLPVAPRERMLMIGGAVGVGVRHTECACYFDEAPYSIAGGAGENEPAV